MMDLEERVTLLEQEVQILKNQIQATLLDIQEHLLTNAYPSLRAEGDAPAPGPAPAPVKTIAARADDPADEAALPAAPDAALPDVAPRSPAAEPLPPPAPFPAPAPRALVVAEPAPVARPRFRRPPSANGPNGRQDARNGSGHDAKVTPFVLDDDFPADVPPGAPVTSADWALMEQLVDWTNRRVERFGARQTRALITRYAEEGRISPDMRDALLQIIAIGAVEPPAPDARPRSVTPVPQAYAGGDEPLSSNVILRLIAGLTSLGSGRSRSASRHG